MIRYFIGLFLVIASTSFAQEAKFSVDKGIHKFQDVQEGILLEHVFQITNTGNAPLIINDYKVACSCTIIELPKAPIAPGQTYKMRLTFDTKGKIEWQDRMILLQTNTKKKEEKLRFKVYVYPKE